MRTTGRREWLGSLLLVVVTAVFSATPAASRVLFHQRAQKAEPPTTTPEFHPIDICIFSCDTCFKGDSLVYCANVCIMTEGRMDPNWRRICRVLDPREPRPPKGDDLSGLGDNFLN